MKDKPTARDPLVGRTLHGYRIEAVVSRSASATVYRATQVSVERPVALKILAGTAAKEPSTVKRFLAMARAAGRVEHKNVVAIHEVVHDPDGLTLVSMEWAGGGSLRSIIVRQRRMSWRDAVRALGSCLRALFAVERVSSVKVDVRPEHVLFSKGGDVKILLTVAGEEAGSAETVDDLVYRAPESIEDGGDGGTTALYALGATFAEALTGKPPYRARSLEELLEQKRARPTPPLGDVAEAPRWLIAFLQRATAGQPDARFQSLRAAAGTLGRELAKLAAGAERAGASGGEERSVSARELARRASGRRRVLPRNVFLLAAGAAFVAVIALIATRGGDDGRGVTEPVAPSSPVQGAVPSAADSAGASSLREENAGKRAAELDRRWTDIERSIRDGALREAAEKLTDLGESLAEARSAAGVRLGEVLALGRGRLEEGRAARESAARDGDFDGVLERLSELKDRLPRELEREIARERRSIVAAREKARAREARIEGTLGDALADALDLRFADARERLRTLAGDERDHPAAIEARGRLEALAELWNGVEEGEFDWVDRLREEIDTASLASRSPGEALPALRDEALAAMVELHARSIAGKRPAALFAATSVRLEGEELTLVYEFEQRAELDDFIAAEGSSFVIERGGRLRLRGEFRLLDGEPFRDRLRVEVMPPDDEGSSDSLAVALWTIAGDRVTFDSAVGGRDLGDPAYDYIVCGLSYDPRSGRARSLVCPGEEYPVLYPCDVLLVGTHGSPLHAAHGWSCLWGRTLLDAPRRRGTLVIEESREGLRWEVGGAAVHGPLPREARAALRRGPRDGREGSASFFTSGTDAVLERLRVSGRVASAWWAMRARRAAIAELRDRLPGVEWPAK